MDHRSATSLALSAGLGGAFGMLLWLAGLQFFGPATSAEEKMSTMVAIVLVAVGIVQFIEPMIERLRAMLIGAAENGDAQAHVETANHQTRKVRLVALLIVIVASLSHGFLSWLIEKNPIGAFGLICSVTLIAGGTTYAWCRAAKRKAWSAMLFGSITGFCMSAAFLGLLYGALGTNLPQFAGKSAPESIAYILISAIVWGIVGLTGGFVIDRGLNARWLLLAIAGPVLSLDTISTMFGMTGAEFGLDLSKMLGWWCGFLVQPRALAMLLKRSEAATIVATPAGTTAVQT